ncbi:hypothetical protein OF377_00005, partial [Ureaplasma sp. ES3154-GEN]
MKIKSENPIKNTSDLRRLFNETNSIRNRLLKVEYCACDNDADICEHQDQLVNANANTFDQHNQNHNADAEACATNVITAEHQTFNIELDVQTCSSTTSQPQTIIKEVEKIVYVDRPVEVIKEVEKIVEVEKPVDVLKEVEKIVYVDRP